MHKIGPKGRFSNHQMHKMRKVVEIFRPKVKVDPVLRRLEMDCEFWREEMKRSTHEYMKASWDLAMYKQEQRNK